MTAADPRTTLARAWWGLLALVVGAAVLTDLVRTVDGAGSATPVIRYLSYFTIQSNLLVVAAAATLARDPHQDGRGWRVLRLDALLGITVTGLVYTVVLAPTIHLQGLSWWTNVAMHYVSPVATLLGWLLLGPRPRITGATVLAALVWPLAYAGYTLAHGAVTGWYPYPFLDVGVLGLDVALGNLGFVVLLALVFLVLFRALDRALPATDRRAEVLSAG
ncbi:Pr6Pr family membrane protein [Modestobacter lacusdianchii]